MRQPILAVLAVAVAVAAAPGAARAAAALAPFEPPTLAMRSCAVDHVELEGATLLARYEVANPNAFDLELAGVRYAVEVDGKTVADGASAEPLRIPAQGSAPIVLPVAVRFARFPSFAAKVALKDAVPYRLSGAVAVRRPDGEPIDLPIDHSDKLGVPKLPGFSLKGIRVRSWNPFDAAIEVKVALENENAFALPSGGIRVRVVIADQDVATADAVLESVPAGARSNVGFPVKISLKRAGKGVVSALKSDEAQVGLVGEASFGELRFPLDLVARVPTR
jgi:LEA14-like dessication related protein